MHRKIEIDMVNRCPYIKKRISLDDDDGRRKAKERRLVREQRKDSSDRKVDKYALVVYVLPAIHHHLLTFNERDHLLIDKAGKENVCSLRGQVNHRSD